MLLLPASIVCMNILFLYRTGEFMSIEDIVTLQQGHPECLYRSAIRNDDLYYKLEGYKQRKPDVAAIGSSRALQFRQAFFTESFYALGNAMTSVSQGEFLLDEMLASHKPSTLLIATDFWWFSSVREDPFFYKTPPNRYVLSPRESLSPLIWMYERKIRLHEYLSVIFHGLPDTPCSLGVAAWKRDGAFAADGSYYYAKELADPPPTCDAASLYKAVETVDINDMWFIPPEATFSEDRLQVFIHRIDTLRTQGIDTTILFPPLSQPVYDALQEHGQGLAFTERIKKELTFHGIPFIDAHDPSKLGSDCDFIDAIHASDVLYERMLKQLPK